MPAEPARGIQDDRAELDRMRRLFARLDAAVTHHQRRHQPEGLLFAEAADEALWKVRDKILADWARGDG